MRIYPAMIALSLAMLSTPKAGEAATPILDGNSLYKWCTSRGELSAACHGYIRGAYERFVLDATVRKGDPAYFCVPSTVDYEQIKDIVVSHLRENPEDRHGFALTLVGRALAQAFPDCHR